MSDDRLCSCGACVEICGKTAYAPGGEPLVWKPDVCPDCLDDVGEPGSRAALEAELTRLREELAKHKPEERAGKCGCGWHEVVETVWCERIQTGPENEDCEPEPIPRWLKFCPRCGWELDHETGVARRNADTARVARVREALAIFPHRKDRGMGLRELQSSYDLATTIRVALDQEVPDE